MAILATTRVRNRLKGQSSSNLNPVFQSYPWDTKSQTFYSPPTGEKGSLTTHPEHHPQSDHERDGMR